MNSQHHSNNLRKRCKSVCHAITFSMQLWGRGERSSVRERPASDRVNVIVMGEKKMNTRILTQAI